MALVKFNRVAPAPSASFEAPRLGSHLSSFGARQEWIVDKDWTAATIAIGVRFNQHNQFDSNTHRALVSNCNLKTRSGLFKAHVASTIPV